jgi:hypothetical protein
MDIFGNSRHFSKIGIAMIVRAEYYLHSIYSDTENVLKPIYGYVFCSSQFFDKASNQQEEVAMSNWKSLSLRNLFKRTDSGGVKSVHDAQR